MKRRSYEEKLYKLQKNRLYQEWTDDYNRDRRIRKARNKKGMSGLSGMQMLKLYGPFVFGFLAIIAGHAFIGILVMIIKMIFIVRK